MNYYTCRRVLMRLKPVRGLHGTFRSIFLHRINFAQRVILVCGAVMTEGGVSVALENDENDCESGWFGWMRWRPTSRRQLVEAEERMLSVVKKDYKRRYVNLSSGERLWTVTFDEHIEDKTPLVIVHGMAGGVGLWALNYDSITGKRPVHAFDLLGFGQSSHPSFEKDAFDSEYQFMESIEHWREAMGLEKMILMGHSFGGFLASSYALKYPDRIQHLILADPWGFPEYDPDTIRRFPFWVRGIAKMISPFNPLAIIRGTGPLGPRLIRLRGDLGKKFTEIAEESGDSPIFDYIYHCNAQNPSGEAGFKNLTVKIGYAQNPMIERIGNLEPGKPVSFVYGAQTWMDIKCGKRTKELLPDNDVQVHSIDDAGHHVYADQPKDFHRVINSICDGLD